MDNYLLAIIKATTVSGTWMPTVEFDLEELFHFKYVDYSRCNKHYCECELYYPISVL